MCPTEIGAQYCTALVHRHAERRIHLSQRRGASILFPPQERLAAVGVFFATFSTFFSPSAANV
jgi:hypothetical protein